MSKELYARANELADIVAIAGTRLRRSGKRLRGPCPLCASGPDLKTSKAFAVDLAARSWKCWACDKHGDAVDLKARLDRCTPREAAEALAGVSAGPPANSRFAEPRRVVEVVAPAGPDDEDAWKAALAAEIWKTAGRAAGSPVETYLRGRGPDGPVLEAALERLRFHPAAPYIAGPDRPAASWVRLPAMVAIVHAPGADGVGVATGGVHLTYLAPDGRSKTHRNPAKKMLGPQGRDGQPGGAWLASPTGEGELIVAEGIESALSAAVLEQAGRPGPRRVVAALSLGRLQGGLLTDAWGRVDPAMPRPDPLSPAFTWPAAGDVVIAVDRDMKPIAHKVRKASGGTYEAAIDGDARARICAALAEAAWRRAGASAARTIAPGPGRDFNDELRARRAAGDLGRAA